MQTSITTTPDNTTTVLQDPARLTITVSEAARILGVGSALPTTTTSRPARSSPACLCCASVVAAWSLPLRCDPLWGSRTPRHRDRTAQNPVAGTGFRRSFQKGI